LGLGAYAQERFPSHRKSKLQPRRDEPFQILERINDTTYKVDMLGEYGVSATFNVSDLTLFDVGDDSRSNPFGAILDPLKKKLFISYYSFSNKSLGFYILHGELTFAL
jgi:hypothetical protein